MASPLAPGAFGVSAEPEEEDTGWQDRALCAQTDPEAFFPETGGSTREAKRVCGSCEVRAECLGYALDHDERFGIWGGAVGAGTPAAEAAGAVTTAISPAMRLQALMVMRWPGGGTGPACWPDSAGGTRIGGRRVSGHARDRPRGAGPVRRAVGPSRPL
jgi:WhiB family redox-sensing transcriptional regulator